MICGVEYGTEQEGQELRFVVWGSLVRAQRVEFGAAGNSVRIIFFLSQTRSRIENISSLEAMTSANSCFNNAAYCPNPCFCNREGLLASLAHRITNGLKSQLTVVFTTLWVICGHPAFWRVTSQLVRTLSSRTEVTCCSNRYNLRVPWNTHLDLSGRQSNMPTSIVALGWCTQLFIVRVSDVESLDLHMLTTGLPTFSRYQWSKPRVSSGSTLKESRTRSL